MRKLVKLDYIIPKAFRPIDLFNTLRNALEFILAKRIKYLAETNRLLLSNPLGAQYASSTKHTLQYMSERTYLA